MAAIRDYAVSIEAAAVASMVCEMPTHETGDLLVAAVNKDATASFNTPAGWDIIQTQASAGAYGGVYAKRAASAAETVTFTYASETACAVILAIKNCYGSTVADATAASAKSGADDSTVPLSGASLADTAYDNSLVIHALSTDTGLGPSALPGWVNLFVGDAGANSLCVSYTHKVTHGALTGPDHWGSTQDDARGFILAVRDNGSNTEVEPYIGPGTTPCVLVTPHIGVTTTAALVAAQKGTWKTIAPLDIASVGGKTLTYGAISAIADSGYNPFRGSSQFASTSSKTVLYGCEMTFSSFPDLTANSGVIFGTWRFALPRDYLDLGKASTGGILIGIADAENDYSFWDIGAQFAKTTIGNPATRANYAIEVSTTDTDYASSGSLALNAINDLYIATAGYYGACLVAWSDLYLLNEVVLAGGTEGIPLDFFDVELAVNNGSGYIPLFVRNGSAATLWTPIRFGGVDPIHLLINLRTFQFPTKADGTDYLDFHISNNKMGIEFYGLSGDDIVFTNCVFTSDSSYYWRFNASHSVDCDIDFSGTTVVNAAVTLRSTVTLTNTIFIDCATFTQNSAVLTSCTFDNTKVTCSSLDDMALISNSSFTSGGTGYAIEVGGSADTITLTGNTFTGYAASSGSTGNEAIYVNIAAGTVTINVASESIPSIRTAGATVNVVANPITTTITVKDLSTDSVIQDANVLVWVTDDTNYFYQDTVSITGSGTTATVSHTAHGMSSGDYVIIEGVTNDDDYNGVFEITKTGDNSYTYTTSEALGASPATGTITATFALISDTTDVNGQVTDTRSLSSDQPVAGWVRKSSGSPYYQQGAISGTVDSSSGLSTTVQLARDE